MEEYYPLLAGTGGGSDLSQPPPYEFLRRQPNEWLQFMGELIVTVAVILSIVHFNECPGMPSLPLYIIIFGILGLIGGVIRMTFRVNARKPERIPNLSRFRQKAVIIANVFHLRVLLYPWGADLTFPYVAAYSRGEDVGCQQNVFIPGVVIACILTAVFIAILIILPVLLVRHFIKRRR